MIQSYIYQSKVDTLLRKVSSILPRIYKIEKIYSINKFAYFKRVPSFQRQTSLQILFDMTNDRQSLPHHYSSLNSNTHRNWRKQQQQNSCRYYYYIGRILNGCQKGLQNITSSYGHHEKNIEFITSGRRPRVINLIFSSDDHNYE